MEIQIKLLLQYIREYEITEKNFDYLGPNIQSKLFELIQKAVQTSTSKEFKPYAHKTI